MRPEIPGTLSHHKLRIKSALGSAVFSVGAHRAIMRNRATVIALHRVDDRVKGNPIGCSIREFESYCDFFADNFRVVSVSTLLETLREGKDITRMLAITFDDGYVDNYRYAAPILESRGLPACFFVSTGLIGSQTQPWWDREFGARAEWMGWDHVRSLHARGFEIGAHTVTHADLGKVSTQEAAREIHDSKAHLEKELRAPVSLFSFPYGGPQRITEAVRDIVRDAGFKCCFSAYGGTISAGEDAFRLRRAPITPWHYSPEQLGFELLFRQPSPPRPTAPVQSSPPLTGERVSAA